MTELIIGSKPWRAIRDYLLARAMYRAACTDGVAKARLEAGCGTEAPGVAIMEAVVKHLPGALSLEAGDTALELEENRQSQAEVEADLAADDPGRSEEENQRALEAWRQREEVLRNWLAVYEHLFRDFPMQVG